MKKELWEQLERGYPFLKNGGFCSCGNGWYDLIDELCGKISERYKLDGKEPDITVDEIKEKYGTLRFEYSHEHYSGEETPLEKDIRELADEYEEKSKTVCEMCGAPGKLRKDLPWIQTLCTGCYAEHVKRVH